MRIYSLLLVAITLFFVGTQSTSAYGKENEKKLMHYRVDIRQLRLDIPYTLLVDGKETLLNSLVCVPRGSKAVLVAGDTEIISVEEKESQEAPVTKVLTSVNYSKSSNLDTIQVNHYLPTGISLSNIQGMHWVGEEEISSSKDPFNTDIIRDRYFELVPDSIPPVYKYVEEEHNLGTKYHLRIQDTGDSHKKMSIRLDYSIASGRKPIEGIDLDVGPLTITKFEDTFENLAVTYGDTFFIEKKITADQSLVSVLNLVPEEKTAVELRKNDLAIRTTVLRLPGFSESHFDQLKIEHNKSSHMQDCQVFRMPDSSYKDVIFKAFPDGYTFGGLGISLGDEPTEMNDALNYLSKQIQPSETFLHTLEVDVKKLEPARVGITADATGDNPREGNWLGTMVFVARPVSANPPYVYLLIENWNDMEALKMDQHIFNVDLPIDQEGTYLLWPEKVEKRELVFIVEITDESLRSPIELPGM
jgi:hypothetical protein